MSVVMKRMFCKIVAVMLAVICMPAVVRAGHDPDGKWTFNDFSGGMMLHIGYVGGGTTALYSPSGIPLPAQKMNGVPYGIGGCAKVYFGEHLRVGTEGYATYLVYGDNASRFGIGWGGLLLDWQWHAGNIHPFVGVTVGGGAATNVTLLSPVYDDFLTEPTVSYRKYGFMAVTPFIGMELEVSQKLRLTFKADWLMNVSVARPDFPQGVRLYFGIIFYHGR